MQWKKIVVNPYVVQEQSAYTKPTYRISDIFRLLSSTENLAGFKFTLGIYELLAVMNF